jgi:hypothetical protein
MCVPYAYRVESYMVDIVCCAILWCKHVMVARRVFMIIVCCAFLCSDMMVCEGGVACGDSKFVCAVARVSPSFVIVIHNV